MTHLNWLWAVLAVSLISLSSQPSSADARGAVERLQGSAVGAVEAGAQSQAVPVAQPRPGKLDRMEPVRNKQAKLEPKPPAEAARVRASANDAPARAGRASRR